MPESSTEYPVRFTVNQRMIISEIAPRLAGKRKEMLEWVDGWFDSEEFDPAVATKSMWNCPTGGRWREAATFI